MSEQVFDGGLSDTLFSEVQGAITDISMSFGSNGSAHNASLTTILNSKNASKENDLGKVVGSIGEPFDFSNEKLQKLLKQFVCIDLKKSRDAVSTKVTYQFKDKTSLLLDSIVILIRGKDVAANYVPTVSGANRQVINQYTSAYTDVAYSEILPYQKKDAAIKGDNSFTWKDQSWNSIWDTFKESEKIGHFTENDSGNGKVFVIGSKYTIFTQTNQLGGITVDYYKKGSLLRTTSPTNGAAGSYGTSINFAQTKKRSATDQPTVDSCGRAVTSSEIRNDAEKSTEKYAFSINELIDVLDKCGILVEGFNFFDPLKEDPIELDEAFKEVFLIEESGTLMEVLSSLFGKIGIYWSIDPFTGIIRTFTSVYALQQEITNPFEESEESQKKYLNISYSENILPDKNLYIYTGTSEAENSPKENKQDYSVDNDQDTNINATTSGGVASYSCFFTVGSSIFNQFQAAIDPNQFKLLKAGYAVIGGLQGGEEIYDTIITLAIIKKLGGLGSIKEWIGINVGSQEYGYDELVKSEDLKKHHKSEGQSKTSQYISQFKFYRKEGTVNLPSSKLSAKVIMDIVKAMSTLIYINNGIRKSFNQAINFSDVPFNIIGPFDSGEALSNIPDLVYIQNAFTAIGGGKLTVASLGGTGDNCYLGVMNAFSFPEPAEVEGAKKEYWTDNFTVADQNAGYKYIGAHQSAFSSCQSAIQKGVQTFEKLVSTVKGGYKKSYKAQYSRVESQASGGGGGGGSSEVDLDDCKNETKNPYASRDLSLREINPSALFGDMLPPDTAKNAGGKKEYKYFRFLSDFNVLDSTLLNPIKIKRASGSIHEMYLASMINKSELPLEINQKSIMSSRTIYGLEIPEEFKITYDSINISIGGNGINTSISESNRKLLKSDYEVLNFDGSLQKVARIATSDAVKTAARNLLKL